jgi:hypothetical protein
VVEVVFDLVTGTRAYNIRYLLILLLSEIVDELLSHHQLGQSILLLLFDLGTV